MLLSAKRVHGSSLHAEVSSVSEFIYDVLRHGRFEASVSPARRLRFIQIHPLSSSIRVEAQNQLSFTANYLINTCGFDPERAIAASKYVKFDAPFKPDSVLAFLKNLGLTQTQVRTCIRNDPAVLSCNPDNTLLPKVKFLKARGFSRTDIARILSRTPTILRRSLENQIIPSFSFFDSLFKSKQKAVDAIKRFGELLLCDLKARVQPNIEILQAAGVPEKNIVCLLNYEPRAFKISTDTFGEVVREVKKMGFNPATMNFVLAIRSLRKMSKSTWEKKIGVYKKWGWSDNEILVAFRKHPQFLTVSEDKIMGMMDFFVNKMGCKSSVIAERPKLICLSFEKRIVPRFAVYQVLVSKGLIREKDIVLMTLLQISEKSFLEKVLKPRQREAPELLKFYEEKLNLLK